MTKILGLDLGTNSIGWAVVDKENNKIDDCGVRIFPEGVVNMNEGEEREKSKNALRRENRQTRRQVARRRMRKIKLLELLIEQGMCPLTHDQLMVWKHWDKHKKSEGRHFPQTEKFIQWLKLNPYELRYKGINGELTKMEFGRFLYHIIQHRGFLSTRKEKETGKIYAGKEDMVGIDDTKKALNGNTLGEYLYSIYPDENESFKNIRNEDGDDLRIRGRYTLRDMYVEEFEKIWQKQATRLGLDKVFVTKQKVVFLNGSKNRNRNAKKIEYLKNNRDRVDVEEIVVEREKANKTLTRVTSYEKISLHDHLGGKIEINDNNIKFDNKDSVLFYQRPLRSQKSLLGKCRYENNKTPVSISHPDYEIFRAWQYVNTIKFGNNIPLPIEQKKVIVDFLKTKKTTVKFADIVKLIQLSHENFNYNDDDKVEGCPTIAQLTKLFSKEGWKDNYHNIWHDFYFFDDSEKLFKKLTNTKEYELKENIKLEDVKKVSIKDDKYSSLSLKAIRNILPFLQRGLLYNQAVVLGGVMNAFNYKIQNDEIPRWERFADYHDTIVNDILAIIKENNKQGEAIEKIKKYLSNPENHYGFEKDDPAFKKLYHHSQEIEDKEKSDKISEIENLRNPIVQRAVQEMRRMVNELLEKYGRFDRIAVEMGREMKLSKKGRQDVSRMIQQNFKANENVREILKEYQLVPSRQNIQKVLLFNEIHGKAGKVVCPYTGKTLNISDLLGNENKVQIEHIIPRSFSLDDSFANKTICDAKFNQLKGNLTPYQFYQKNNDKKLWGAASWEEIEQRAYSVLPFNKAKRFTTRKTEWKTEEFISRQLNDDRYISKKTKEILSEVCNEILVMPGKVTADLRRLWGLNNILQPTIGLPDDEFDIDHERDINYWAVTDEKRNIKKLYPMNNPRPDVAAEETVVTGYVTKNKFKAHRLNLEFEAPEIPDGKYYVKFQVSKPLKTLRQYVDKPDYSDDEIILRGMINRSKFNHDSLKRRIDAPKNIDDGSYWAKFKITEKRFEEPQKNKRPENKNGICLFGKVKNHVFTSYIYQCETDLDDGQYWVLLDLDFENIEFIATKNEKPEIENNQLLVLGDINEEGTFTALHDIQLQFNWNDKPGRYWAVLNILSEKPEFAAVENKPPKIENDEKLIEGKIWVDHKTGEIRFDPKKNRDDHRHHAVDAIAIALTDYNIINQLNRYNAQKDALEKGIATERPYFEEPWENFFQHAKEAANKILVSHHKDNTVTKKVSMIIEKNGKKYRSEGQAVRGQLHMATVYGRRETPGKGVAYHMRIPVERLDDNKINKIADNRVQGIIKYARQREKFITEQIKALKKDRAKAGDEEEKRIDEQVKLLEEENRQLYTLPNKKGDRVPIKKVRVRENLGNTEMLKPSENTNQYVNPRNNHHVMIYKDSEGQLRESIVTLWEAAERKNQGNPVYQLPNDGVEIVSTLEVNDMFLLGLDKEQTNDIRNLDKQILSKHLYRVQNLSSLDYTFRHHLASTVSNLDEKYRIQSFGAWEKVNPLKVKINQLGKITSV
ncbi:MAG: CRISPR-associated endonuclease Csn1 [Bacteroidales bacterium]|nr:CRISPR-associated endonuclease Csn1 [Bacteroidales bacterium]